MDRGKLPVKRPAKGKGHAPPGEFFALGNKPEPKTGPAAASTAATIPRKPSTSSLAGSKSSTSSLAGSKQSTSTTSSSQPAAKKPKIGAVFTPLGRHGDTEIRRASPTTQQHMYDDLALEVDPSEFLDTVNDAAEREDDERVEALLCGSVKYLKAFRSRPEGSMSLSLMYLSKYRPSVFSSEVIIEAFCSLLKREVSLSFKSKGNPTVSILTCNILLAAFMDEENWPDQFIKVYMEDAMAERVWVDRDDCKAFVENIQTAFNTKMPKISALMMEGAKEAGTSSPVVKMEEDDVDSLSGLPTVSKATEDDVSSLVSNRYNYQTVSIESYVLDILREQLGRRQSMDGGSRNLLRVMTATCGYAEVRTMAATRLEMWLQNPKLTRPAQDLLMSVCLNCDQHSHIDIEVMSQLSKIRLKTKPLISHYLLSVRELLIQHTENLRTLMTHTVYNELSNSRNPNNMALLGVMFSYSPDPSAKILAEIFQDLLANREEYLRSLRILLREIVRTVRQDMNFAEFAIGLMKERTENKFKDMEPALKERLFVSLTDLITLTSLLGVSPSVKEAASAHARSDDKDLEVLRKFQQQVALIQRDSVSWLHTVAPKMFDVKQNEYVHCLRKMLFMEAPEHYTKIDNWPPENDRSLILRLVTEVPVLEDTLLRILIMGLTRETPVNATDAIELVDQLVKRAAALHAEDYQVLSVDRVDLIDLLLNLCTYRHPENISLPKGYKPPALAITNLYWRAWVIMLIISAFNPTTLGFTAWSNYPMLKCLMEMVMTRNFKFPPPTMINSEDKTADDIKNQQNQLNELEKQQIVEFEGHLAAATSRKQITPDNSLLLAQLTAMDPSGPPRPPPKQLLEQLEALNNKLGIGHLLCRSRNPDFLLDIIHRQGTSQSMPWLAELVESNDSSLDVLPVQCLCEFLLHDATNEEETTEKEDDGDTKGSKTKQKLHKQQQLLGRLQTLLHSATSDPRPISEVLGYFLKRLSSQGRSNRVLAVKGLSIVLSQSHLSSPSPDPDEPMDVEENPALVAIPTHKWLLEQLPGLPQFLEVRQATCAALRQACQVETDAAAVSAYIVFLSQHTADLQLQELDELALDLAQLIVERATLMNHLLPQEGLTVHQKRADFVLASMMDLFYGYLLKAQQPDKEAYNWSNTQDQILLQWDDDKSATINVLVVHAMIILLTYGKPKGNSCYDVLLEAWFPSEGHPPSAYLVDTSEEALLLPDWLKLRMIRSRTERLVDAALMDLEPSQLLLFVQSFGIPVASMSKLLKCLDRAVTLDCYAMEQVVVDKGYMAQLVQVQHMRGAQGGVRFHQMLAPDGMPDPVMSTEDIEMKSIPPKRCANAPPMTRIQPITAKDTKREDMVEILYKIFDVHPGTSDVTRAEQQCAVRSLHKGLSNTETCEELLTSLEKILSGDDRDLFVSAMKKSLHISCPILRLLIAKQAVLSERLFSVMSSLAKRLEGSKSALVGIVTAYLAQRQKIARHSAEGATGSQRDGDKDEMDTEDSDDGVVALNLPKSQRSMNQTMAQALKCQKVNARIKMLCHALKQQANDRLTPSPTHGLVIDWLQLLDPELTAHGNPQEIQDLLFVQSPPGGVHELSPGSVNELLPEGSSSQPYLLALLTQQSDWATLHRYLNLLLSAQIHNVNPTTALDFVNACVYLPKIWQGRDKKIPKNALAEDILHLDGRQIVRLVDYILAEAMANRSDASSNHANEVTRTSDRLSQLAGNTTSSIPSRLSLLLQCCASRHNLLCAAVKHLTNRVTEKREDRVFAQQLLLQIYLQIPDIVTVTTPLVLASGANASQTGISQLDSVTHRIVCTLGNAAPGKAIENCMYDANIALRKLAAQHPVIVLRQLPIMSALLQSRAQFTFTELKHRNHLLLYTHILGVLELLQPYVFNTEYEESLKGIIASFFELIRIHRSVRLLGSVITKFIKFLNNFMIYCTKDAGRMLHGYTHTLSELAGMYHDLVPLRSLLSALSLPHQNQEPSRNDADKRDLDLHDADMPRPPRPSSPWSMVQLTPYIQRIAKGSATEDVLTVLRDLDETSKRKVDVLQHFISDLQRLLSERDDQCRNTAHSLVMRYVRQEPGCASRLIPGYLECLTSTNVDVVNSALRNLPEFCLLAHEFAGELLQKVFEVGIITKVETVSYISEAIQLLNMETLV